MTLDHVPDCRLCALKERCDLIKENHALRTERDELKSTLLEIEGTLARRERRLGEVETSLRILRGVG